MGYEKDLTDWKSIRSIFGICDPAGARTQDPNIKSVVLYLLSYRVNLFERAKVRLFSLPCRFSDIFFSFIQNALTLTDDNNLIVSAIYNGTLLVFTRTAVDDDVHQILVAVMNFFGVGEIGVDFVLRVG